MSTLHLNLKRRWFDMILSGNKTDEYREIKPSFCSRFLLVNGQHKKPSWWSIFLEWNGKGMIKSGLNMGYMTWKEYDTNTFVNGMTPPIPEFEIVHKRIEIGTGRPEWGAVDRTEYFVIKLGAVLSKKNVT